MATLFFFDSGEVLEGTWERNEKVGHGRNGLKDSGAFWCHFHKDSIENGADNGLYDEKSQLMLYRKRT